MLLIVTVVPFASAQDTKLPPDVRISEASKLDKSQAGYYRMKIGMIDVIALTDGAIGVDFLPLLTNTKPGEVESLLAREYVKPTAVEASMNAYLIQLDNKLILVDTGAGELLGPKLDKLPDSLRSIGIQPELLSASRSNRYPIHQVRTGENLRRGSCVISGTSHCRGLRAHARTNLLRARKQQRDTRVLGRHHTCSGCAVRRPLRYDQV